MPVSSFLLVVFAGSPWLSRMPSPIGVPIPSSPSLQEPLPTDTPSSAGMQCNLEAGTALSISARRQVDWSLLGAAYREAASDELILEVAGSSRPLGVEQSTLLRQEIRSAANGAPRLYREYEELKASIQHDSWHAEGTSRLVGKEVVFDVKAPDEGASYAPLSRGPDELLSGLLFDASLSAIARDGTLEVGAEWTVDSLGLRSVLQPGGAHYIVPGSCGKSRHGPTGLPGILALGHDLSYSSDSLDGELRARVVEFRETGGVTLALVAVEVELECKADLSEAFKRALEVTEGSQPDDWVAGTRTLQWSSEETLQGTLIWDLTNHRPRELAVEGSVSLELRFSAVLPGLGYRPEAPVVYFSRLEGEVTQVVGVEEWEEGPR